MNFSAIIPQDLRTTASPTFTGLTLTGLSVNNGVLYASSSDVLTQSANLTFDGSKLICTGSIGINGSPAYALDVTGQAKISGGIGVAGGIPSTEKAINIDYMQASNNVIIGIYGEAVNSQPRTTIYGSPTAYGLYFSGGWAPVGGTGALSAPSSYGMYVAGGLQNNSAQSATLNVAYGCFALLMCYKNSTGAAHVTTAYNYFSGPVLSIGGTTGTLYGFYDSGIAAATTTTAWGYYGLTGNNYIKALQIGGTATAGMGTGTLSVAGLCTLTGVVLAKRTLTANDTVLTSDYTLLIDTASTDVTASLPASPTTGQIFNLKCIDAANIATVSGNGKTIDGAASMTLALYENVTVQYDGTEWWIIG